MLSAADAKSLAQQMLARAWAERDKLTLRLSPAWLDAEPGKRVVLPLNPSTWTIEKTTIDGFVVVAELRPWAAGIVGVAADAGRIVQNNDVVAGAVTLALLDIPNVLGLPATEPAVIIAASAATSGWRQRPTEVAVGGQSIAAQTARGKSLLGNAMTVLGDGGTDLVDDVNSVDVELVDPEQWLTSCDEDALASGINLAVLGHELIQFGRVTPLGPGQFRLSHLLRGRGGTEWACRAHDSDDIFCVIQGGTLQAVALSPSSIGGGVTATMIGGTAASLTFSGEGLRQPSPVRLSAELQPSGDLAVNWIRRSRTGFAWVDEIDAPLGETTEQYRVSIAGTLSSVELLASEPSLTVPAATLAMLGTGAAAISVRQIGDFAASRPAQLTFTLS